MDKPRKDPRERIKELEERLQFLIAKKDALDKDTPEYKVTLTSIKKGIHSINCSIRYHKLRIPSDDPAVREARRERVMKIINKK